MDDLTRLLLDARDGDRLALHAAVRASQADVWRLAAHLVGTADADDVTQDVYVRMWRSLPRFRGESSGRTWLLVIARRACVDALRRRGRRQRLAAAVSVTAALQGAGDGGPTTAAPDAAVTLEQVVAGLATDRRVAFVLTQVVGCSYDETAAVCGVPVGTVRSRVARARQDLLAALAAAEAV